MWCNVEQKCLFWSGVRMRSTEHLFGVNAAGDGGMKVEGSMGEGREKMLEREESDGEKAEKERGG